MEINYLAVVVCGIAAMVTGFIWFGPLFGKVWMKVIGATPLDPAAMKEMQKKVMPLYALQFLLVLLQAYILAHFIQAWSDAPAYAPALFIFVGFIVPTVASASMWNNDSAKIAWTRFFVQSGYHLLNILLFAFIFTVLG